MLARAFYDDPVFGWFFPAEGSRHRRLRRFFVTELHRESLRHGAVEAACADGRVAGAAVWFPPGTSFGTEVSALPGYLRAFGRRLAVPVGGGLRPSARRAALVSGNHRGRSGPARIRGRRSPAALAAPAVR